MKRTGFRTLLDHHHVVTSTPRRAVASTPTWTLPIATSAHDDNVTPVRESIVGQLATCSCLITCLCYSRSSSKQVLQPEILMTHRVRLRCLHMLSACISQLCADDMSKSAINSIRTHSSRCHYQQLIQSMPMPAIVRAHRQYVPIATGLRQILQCLQGVQRRAQDMYVHAHVSNPREHTLLPCTRRGHLLVRITPWSPACWHHLLPGPPCLQPSAHAIAN